MNINLSDQNCLTNASMGRTGPDNQNIPGHRDLLINEKIVCVITNIFTFLRQYIKITLTLIKHLVIFPHKSCTAMVSS